MRTENGLVIITLFLGRIILRSYVMRVLLVATTVIAERAEVVYMSNEIKLKCSEVDVAEKVSFSAASHIQ